MAQVQRMDGQNCAFYVRRRCTRTRDPVHSESVRCSLLEARRKVGARTLDRLDRLKRLGDPEDREVARRHVIQKNLDEITRLNCQLYVPKGGRGPVCVHQHLIYCLLLMPECTGRCENYLLKRNDSNAKGGGK